MKILLTGADGFTGTHFLAQALKAGHEVIALKADLNDIDTLNREVISASPDAVVHLAAISFVGHGNAQDFYSVNVIGTSNLLNALSQPELNKPKILIASSANVYGNCENSPIVESELPAPVNHYATSKIACEYMAKTYLDKLNLFFVRPFNYTGVGQSENFIIPKLVKHFKEKIPTIELGNIEVEREFNDVRFVCDSYLKLLNTADTGETYNICSGNAISLTEVIKTLTSITGHQIDININPNFVRKNEVFKLVGSPEKLKKQIGLLEMPKLSDTLYWMLNA